MSIKKPQLILLSILFLGFGVFQYLKPRTPIRKSFSPDNILISQFSSLGMRERIINLKIETSNLDQKDAVLKTEVVALVSLPFDFDDQLQYKWTLGQDVSLIEGQLKGSTEKGFLKNEPQRLKISVRGYSKENLRHINLEVWGIQSGRRLYADGVISSQKEESFENTVQQVEKIRAKNRGLRK